MKYFDNKDHLWEEVAEFVDQQTSPSTIIAGPRSFINILPNFISYEILANFQSNYYDLIIIHKGECLSIGADYLNIWLQQYSAIFANPVFIVLSKQPRAEIDRSGNDFLSLSNQVSDLPKEQILEKNIETESIPHDPMDYQIIISFLNKRISKESLILAPQTVCKEFPNSINEFQLFNTSFNTANYAVVSMHSLLTFPYLDLKKIIESYHAIYSDQFFAIFSKEKPKHAIAEDGLIAVIYTAIKQDNHLVQFKNYRDSIIGGSA